MLLLFESAAGFCLFKVLNEGKLKEADTQVGGRRACPRRLLWRWGAPMGLARAVAGASARMHAAACSRCGTLTLCRMSGPTLRPLRPLPRCFGQFGSLDRYAWREWRRRRRRRSKQQQRAWPDFEPWLLKHSATPHSPP